jgi:hypothetical protein
MRELGEIGVGRGLDKDLHRAWFHRRQRKVGPPAERARVVEARGEITRVISGLWRMNMENPYSSQRKA